MATVTGYTAARMQEIEDSTVVDGDIIGDNLVLIRRDLVQITAGNVRGPQGIQGPAGATSIIICTSGTRPGAPAEGQAIYETDTNRTYIWDGTAWKPFGIFSINPGCKVRRTTAQSIPDSAATLISWQAEDWDYDAMWSAGAPTDVIIKTAGVYTISANFRLDSGAAQWGTIYVNGTKRLGYPIVPVIDGTFAYYSFTTIPYRFAANEVITVELQHNAGSARDLSIQNTGRDVPALAVTWVGP
jgi:hypothetical protein